MDLGFFFKIIRKYPVLALLMLNINAKAQNDKIVSLIVSGQATTIENARQNALRNAIEQAFGTFISSKTEVLNDELVKDQIISVSNGNIQGYEIVSQLQIPNGDYVISLKASVSITKLTSFVESKGFIVEFNGNLFASNVLIQELYEKNEEIVIKNLISTLKSISTKSFDYSLNASDPFSNNGNWKVPITINVIANENFLSIPTLLYQTINSICLTKADLDNYRNLNKSAYKLILGTREKNGIFYLRNKNSIVIILDFIYSLNNSITNFYISNGVEDIDFTKFNLGSMSGEDIKSNISDLKIFDDNFRVILRDARNGIAGGLIAASLFHNKKCLVSEPQTPNFNFKDIYNAEKGHYDDKDLMSYNVFYNKEKDRFYDSEWRGNYFKDFIPLRKLMLANQDMGLIISFALLNPSDLITKFKFNDIRSIEEIKKIKKYEVVRKN
jgi:hypothetical protein